jgi:Vault protein inter-alpha-trypsin domain/von Willebrand factor type A domain
MDALLINYLPRSSGLFLYVPNTGSWTRYLPCSITSIKVKASIVDMVSRVTLTQTFSNDNAHVVYEALYRFPLYESSAVCGFQMEYSGRKVVGIVKAEEEAIKTYETAKSEGKTAALVLQKEPDIFQTKVGNIPPNTSITVILTYITPLKQDTESNAVRFTLPTAIAPRYGDGTHSGANNVSLHNTGFELTLNAKMPSQVTSVSSPSHPIAMTLSSATSAQVTLSNTSPALDKDIVVLVTAKDIDEPRCVIETHPTMATKCAMLSLVPRFNLPRASTEVIFIVDRSGSMVDKVDTLKRALQIFLKSLPASPDIFFNICSFGSNYDFLFKDGKSKKYDSQTLKTAEDYVSKVRADYGGTEIYMPLLDCMKKRRTDCQTTIILLTDGQVYNTDVIINSISQEKAKQSENPLRIFSLGIGDAVSHHLVEGIARAGGGYSQLVMQHERLDRKVVRMLSAGLQVPLNNLHLDWPGKPPAEEMVYKLVKSNTTNDFEVVEKPSKSSTTFFDKEAEDTASIQADPPPQPPKFILDAPIVQQFPETIPPLYNASRHVLFILFPSSYPTPQDVTLKATTPDNTLISLNIPVTAIKSDDDDTENPVIHTLAARTLLSELQEGRLLIQQRNADDSLKEVVKEEGIRIGVKYGLASEWTGFVAVDELTRESLNDKNQGAAMVDTGEYIPYCSGSLQTMVQSTAFSSASASPPRAFGSFASVKQPAPFASQSMNQMRRKSTQTSNFSTFSSNTGSVPGSSFGQNTYPSGFGLVAEPQGRGTFGGFGQKPGGFGRSLGQTNQQQQTNQTGFSGGGFFNTQGTFWFELL